MRGEQDTPIMGKDATLQDNIDLLRDVLKTQNELIRRHVNPDLTAVQRLFVLFTEVEAFYYGDAQTPGLMGDPEKPRLTYRFAATQFGDYELALYVAPSNTATMEHLMLLGVQMNGGETVVRGLVGPDFASLDLSCQEWDDAVRNNVRISRLTVPCRKRLTTLTLYAMSPMAVLERLVLHPMGREIPASYLGPWESWQVQHRVMLTSKVLLWIFHPQQHPLFSLLPIHFFKPS